MSVYALQPMHTFSFKLTYHSGLDIRTARRHKASILDARDCWSNSRALCEKFSAHTSEVSRAIDLTLATPLASLLKTAVFVPFFLTKNAFIKTRNRCIFLHPHQTRLFRYVLQLCLSVRRKSNDRGRGTQAK